MTTLSSIEAEYNEIVRNDGWHSLFQEIREKSEKEAKDKHFTHNESSRGENRSMNRYRDVNPYDHSRIILNRSKTDYINANLVKMERADRKYILTQGPLRETVGHFWLMIWEQQSKAILMLNKLIEKKQVKCHLYWPEQTGEEHLMSLKDVGLNIEYVKGEEYTNYCKRWFKVTDTKTRQSREVIQFHYTTWPDFGIPSSPVAFLQFLKKVRDSGALSPEVGPAVVHCSAGIGRSGTFCLVDCCLVLIEREGENNVSVREILYELRRYRMGLIQTADQLYFSYQAIIEGMKQLKDPEFLGYEEVPKDLKDQGEELPPIPPVRYGSLGGPQQNGNNTSTSVIQGIGLASATTDNANQTKNGTTGILRISPADRPLPPLPVPPTNDLESKSDDEESSGIDKEFINEINTDEELEEMKCHKSDDDSINDGYNEDNKQYYNNKHEPTDKQITETNSENVDDETTAKRIKLGNDNEAIDSTNIPNGISDRKNCWF
ncbi:tyrosine-protein phosphatase non-receptor type 61F isoform X2 [Condylostylus longicornis]|uniref:tyrosine-protein phosphatase non-receptor type 61F isoform X2 n=1 Tax=Condylostylus longicornis TaxID=2530218 RepID=UPI00244DAC4D|nr:tyrosine-protein phosphatase non-receptor type 61F isoform X2 [Condylostylus longicornis]